MKIARTILLIIVVCLYGKPYAQTTDSIDTVVKLRKKLENLEGQIMLFKKQLDSIAALEKKSNTVDDANAVKASLQSDFIPEFKRISGDAYTKIGTGFVVMDKESHRGLFTASMELLGAGMNYHFKRELRDGIVLRAPVSLNATVGWGPTLVAENTVYNYWYFTSGVSVKRFMSAISYRAVFAVNSSGNESTHYLYGGTITLDGIQTPFFASFLLGDKGFQYLGVAGIKIPWTHLIPFGNKRRKI